MTPPLETHASPRSPAQVLAVHHEALRQRLERLVVRAQQGDPGTLRAEWKAFERELLRHLELEEAEILPAFVRHHPDEARALLAEHALIRATLLEMGMDLDLHLLRAEAVQDFVDRLEAHARREDAVLYPWAAAHLPAGTWQAVKRGLEEAAAAVRRWARFNDRIM